MERRSYRTCGFILMACLLVGVIPSTTMAKNDPLYTNPVQLTTDSHYDRNPSILLADDGTYWLFFTRGRDDQGVRGYPSANPPYEPYDPDMDYYDIYYKTARSLPGLLKATELKIPGPYPNNAQRDVAALQAGDGTIWVFTSTGLGQGTDRAVYFYQFKDSAWSGPEAVPDTYYAAHVDAVEKDGRIWVFYDIGYELFVTSYPPETGVWTTPVSIAHHATIAKAMTDDGMFYVAWVYIKPPDEWGPGIYLSSSDDGNSWTSTQSPIAAWGNGLTNWDPVLIKDRKIFWLYWAPSDTEQFIATSSSSTPMDTASWSAPVRMTRAGYGEDTWWDFWPEPISKGRNGGGTLALLYASERNPDGTGMTDGNIWMEIAVPRGIDR